MFLKKQGQPAGQPTGPSPRPSQPASAAAAHSRNPLNLAKRYARSLAPDPRPIHPSPPAADSGSQAPVRPLHRVGHRAPYARTHAEAEPVHPAPLVHLERSRVAVCKQKTQGNPASTRHSSMLPHASARAKRILPEEIQVCRTLPSP